MAEYRAITIKAGSAGYGGPLTIEPTEKCNKVLCVTGENVSPIAEKIAEMTGGELVNGWKTTVPDEEVMIAVVDCGGTARCGVYPKKGIFTVNLTPVGKSGPLAQYIEPNIYVSDVTEKCLSYADEGAAVTEKAASVAVDEKTAAVAEAKEEAKKESSGGGGVMGTITKIGVVVGNVVNKFFAAGRSSIQMCINNILPFMAFTSTILGIISASGLGNVIANVISPFCSTLPGMIIISLICGLPFLSPILGPGAVIAQIVGVLLGSQIAMGAIPARFALPALFAIDAQVGCDFVPVGLSLAEAEPDTIEYGVPAVLFTRVLTGPIAVIIAFIFSIGMYT